MLNAVIYYKENKNASIDTVITHVQQQIESIEIEYIIKNVFIDTLENDLELERLIASLNDDIKIVFINTGIIQSSPFNYQILKEICRTQDYEMVLY